MAGIFPLTHAQEETLNLEAARMRLRKDEEAVRIAANAQAAEIADLRKQLAASLAATTSTTPVVQPQ
jgi:hypothetical protein